MKRLLSILCLILLPVWAGAVNTYYVKNGGSDAASGLSDALAWETIAKVNGAAATLSEGDTVAFVDNSTWRETALVIPKAGVTYTHYGSGNLPRLWGSTLLATWADEGSNIWYATQATDPVSVWFVGTTGTIIWGTKQTLKTDLNAEFEWWWDDPNNRLYVYAASDPDARYSSIEIPTRQYCVSSDNKSNITISYLDTAFTIGGTDPEGIHIYRGDTVIVEYNNVHHIGDYVGGGTNDPYGNGIGVGNLTNSSVRNNTISFAARRGIVNWSVAGYAHNANIVEHNTISNCAHAGIDIFLLVDGTSLDDITIRGNYIFNTDDYAQGSSYHPTSHGIFLAGPGATSDLRLTNAKIYNNIVTYRYDQPAFTCDRRVNGAEFYNNVAYGYHAGSTSGNGFYFNGADYVSNITLKNNIGMDTYYAAFTFTGTPMLSVDYNLWYQSGGGEARYTTFGGLTYHYNDQAAYIAALTALGVTGADTNGKWQDPLFISTSNFRLKPNSPAINAGVAVGLTTDYAGRAVPVGSAPDIGAYERSGGGVSKIFGM